MEEKKEIWFPAKKYGFGWGLPITWQGWAVLPGYLFLVMIGSLMLPDFKNRLWFLPCFLMLTVLSIFIVLKKGEKPKWRWGDKK